MTVSVVDPGANLSPTQFVMTLGELRNAGAEAIDLNGVRLTTRSAFTGQAGAIVGGRHAHRFALHVDGHRGVSDDRDRTGHSGWLCFADARQGCRRWRSLPTDHVTIDSLATPRPPQYATYE